MSLLPAGTTGTGTSAMPSPPHQPFHCEWSEQLCLPARPTWASGSTVFALYYTVEGQAPTTVYYRATLKGKGQGQGQTDTVCRRLAANTAAHCSTGTGCRCR